MAEIHQQRNLPFMKKSILLTALIALFMLNIRAQQAPLYSQLYFMRMLYNPALTAYNGSTNLWGFYREQWTYLPGHPVTAGVLGEVSLWKDQIGVGFHVYEDNTDIIHRINAQAYYAQKIHLAKDHILSLGFSAGIMEAHVDFNNAIASDADDPHLLLAGKSGIAFDMNVGLAYQWKKLTIGFSVPQVINTQAKLADQLNTTNYSNKRQFIGSASYEISIAQEKFNIEPSVLIKSGMTLPLQVDGNIMFNYKRFLYLGVGYRMDYGVSMMAAVRISKAVTIGYAYEYPIMKSVTYSDTHGTHEVIVGICFDKWMKKKVKDKDLLKMDHKIDSLMAKNDSIQKALDSLR
ncbi:MAG: rane protein, partial [Bacteroidota bacterium]|nr:rane protein [Bacteroidota bacterium]